MNKELQFAKTKADLLKKIKYLIDDEGNPPFVRKSFKEWLAWFNWLPAKITSLKDINEESLYYRAFTIPDEHFYAVQIWEKHPTENLIRCVKTLFSNKVNVQYWTDNVIPMKKREIA